MRTFVCPEATGAFLPKRKAEDARQPRKRRPAGQGKSDGPKEGIGVVGVDHSLLSKEATAGYLKEGDYHPLLAV